MKRACLSWSLLAVAVCSLACEGTREEPVTERQTAAGSRLVDEGHTPSFMALDGGGVQLSTNLIRGTVRLTNQNPLIATLLAGDPWHSGSVSLQSTRPTGYVASSSDVTFTSPGEFSFEMLVEAGAGGDDGVAYDIKAYRGSTSFQSNLFPIYRDAVVKRPELQPQPTEVTMERCIGVVQFQAGTDATCTTPARLTGLSTSGAFDVYTSQDRYIGYVPAGFHETVTVNYGVATSSGTVSGSQQVSVSAGCDEIVSVCLPTPQPPPPSGYGAVAGPWEILGEPASLSGRVWAFGGPEGRTWSSLTRAPSSPENSPSTWWKVSNLPASRTGGYQFEYSLNIAANLRSGRELTDLTSPYLWGKAVIVSDQTTVVTQEINGGVRHPFVMRPSYFHGKVRLADPYVALHPGAQSSLASLLFASDQDANADGAPDLAIANGTCISAASERDYGKSAVGLLKRYAPELGELSTDYELVLASPYDVPRGWIQDFLQLRLWSEPLVASAFKTRPGMYDPARFVSGTLQLSQAQNIKLLGPLERYRVDHQYCFNELEIKYWTSLGRFYNPRTTVQGNFTGTDWLGHSASYKAAGEFQGMPAVLGYPSQPSYAQPSGTTRMSLPQGTFTLSPSATMVNDSGQENTASFAPISLTLGCGQRLKVVPPLTVSINPIAGCAPSAAASVTGTVKSTGAGVDRVWYTLNDGEEVTLCTQCGIDPSFSFSFPLQACVNDIKVFAFSAGMPEPSIGYQQTVWDDPVDGPSCADSSCANRPPVARCKDVTLPLALCSAEGTPVNDGSYEPDTGDTLSCVQTPGGSYGEGPHQVTLTCTDRAGLSSSCAATVTCSSAPSCLEVRLSDYNLFLLGDYTGGHDVAGKVAAGGNITLTDFAVGSGLSVDDAARVLVAGGDLKLSRGAVFGDAWHGGSYSADPSVIFPRGAASQGMPIDFPARGAALRALSARLDGLTANGTTVFEPWGGIMLSGTSSKANVFDVAASRFSGAKLLSINAPAGSLVVLNIHGSEALFTGFGHSFGGGIDQHGILYNFVDATAIHAHGYGFWGTVLAPYAHLDFSDGSWDGGIYARSLSGNAEGHLNMLSDYDICP
ncbi:choice-of-anchor A family protein [Hyalangium versicolor]|uniref:choice-of-anchor A family protein n=1 Tax=Hyalangium versicolor TaxID=2861190 RepID=UPI001CCCCEC1|nr:choice-of-anchor A family protein [Hyalangium versicolor]